MARKNLMNLWNILKLIGLAVIVAFYGAVITMNLLTYIPFWILQTIVVLIYIFFALKMNLISFKRRAVAHNIKSLLVIVVCSMLLLALTMIVMAAMYAPLSDYELNQIYQLRMR